MASLGLQMVYFALRDLSTGQIKVGADGLSESGVFAIDTDKSKGNLGTKQANITNLSGSNAKINGNDRVVDVSKGQAAPSIAIDSNAINHEVKEKILGHKKVNGYWVPTDENVEVACVVVTRDPVDRKELYMGFGRGICTESSMDVQTNTDTAETRSDDQITFEALSFDGFEGKPFVRAYASDSDFDKKKFFDAVMPGQTLFATSSQTPGK